MKKIRLRIEGVTLFLMLLMLGACDDTSKKKNSLPELNTLKPKAVEWHLDSLKKQASEEYKSFVQKRGRFYMDLTDALTGKVWTLQPLNFEDTLYQTSENVACVTANMRTFHTEPEKGEPVKVDYRFVWDKEQGQFEIRDIFIRQVNETVIYEWVKKGDYYERMNPEEKAAQEALQKMDSTNITT